MNVDPISFEASWALLGVSWLAHKKCFLGAHVCPLSAPGCLILGVSCVLLGAPVCCSELLGAHGSNLGDSLNAQKPPAADLSTRNHPGEF